MSVGAAVAALIGIFVVGILDNVNRVEQVLSFGWLTQWGEAITVALLVLAVVVFLYETDRKLEAVGAGVDERRGGRNSALVRKEWVDLSDAAFRFGDKKTRQDWVSAHDEVKRIETLISDLEVDVIFSIDEKLTSEIDSKIMTAKEDLEKARSKSKSKMWAIDYDLKQKLKNGDLVATGLVHPPTPGRPPIVIPKEEWDFLEAGVFDNAAEGEGVKYLAVRVERVTRLL